MFGIVKRVPLIPSIHTPMVHNRVSLHCQTHNKLVTSTKGTENWSDNRSAIEDLNDAPATTIYLIFPPKIFRNCFKSV
jgi:hypothetical protein